MQTYVVGPGGHCNLAKLVSSLNINTVGSLLLHHGRANIITIFMTSGRRAANLVALNSPRSIFLLRFLSFFFLLPKTFLLSRRTKQGSLFSTRIARCIATPVYSCCNYVLSAPLLRPVLRYFFVSPNVFPQGWIIKREEKKKKEDGKKSRRRVKGTSR